MKITIKTRRALKRKKKIMVISCKKLLMNFMNISKLTVSLFQTIVIAIVTMRIYQQPLQNQQLMSLDKINYWDSYLPWFYLVSYSIVGMRLWLINNGFRYKKSHVMLVKANLEKQEQFINVYNKLMQNLSDDELLYFMDSVHPQHQARPSYGWIVWGKRKTIATNSGQKRIHITGSISLDNMNVIHKENEWINSDSVVEFLKKSEKANSKCSRIYLVCDNASYHKGKKVKKFLENSGIKLLFLPSYSLNLNSIERLWKVMHENVTYNKYYLNFKDFVRSIRNFFAEIPKLYNQLVDRVTGNFFVVKFNPVANSST